VNKTYFERSGVLMIQSAELSVRITLRFNEVMNQANIFRLVLSKNDLCFRVVKSRSRDRFPVSCVGILMVRH
jgi:hypothetical protein